jgi:hypothetical protein
MYYKRLNCPTLSGCLRFCHTVQGMCASYLIRNSITLMVNGMDSFKFIYTDRLSGQVLAEGPVQCSQLGQKFWTR